MIIYCMGVGRYLILDSDAANVAGLGVFLAVATIWNLLVAFKKILFRHVYSIIHRIKYPCQNQYNFYHTHY